MIDKWKTMRKYNSLELMRENMGERNKEKINLYENMHTCDQILNQEIMGLWRQRGRYEQR